MPTFQVLFSILLCLIGSVSSHAQSIQVEGNVEDIKSNEKIIGAKVILIPVSDTLSRNGATTDIEGKFSIQNVQTGDYTLKITAYGYSSFEQAISINAVSRNLGTILVSKDVLIVDEVTVETKMTRVEQNGDTTSYNADAFKTNPDASIEELVSKMPGITIENGVVKSNGEDIKKVLIDGEEFFGDDATAALKNLPAEIVAKIQVFDKESDQAQFTGVSDGNEAKALNIVTKSGKNAGQFGKIYAGYGTDNHYLGGLNLNLFNKKQRISIIGMSNNVNQQNFSTEDILGVQGSSSSSSGQGGGRRGGGATDNFLVGGQNGISQTHSLGINYADQWGKKTKVTGSYFFNASENINDQTTNREFILSDNSGQLYTENYTSRSTNFNHRFNMKFDFTLDSNNMLTYTPRLSFQQNKSSKITDGLTNDRESSLINSLTNDYSSQNIGYTINNDLLWRHKFSKPKRSLSIDIKTAFNSRNGENGQFSDSYFVQENGDSTNTLNQRSKNATNGYTFSTRLSYTEPMGEKLTGELYYNPSYSVNNADKRTNGYDSLEMTYSDLDTSLSNVFDNTTFVNQAGLNFRRKGNKTTIQLGASYQNTSILNNQEFPTERNVNLTFNSILPNAMFKYEFSKTAALRIFYRTQTRAPSIDQLQNVIDNSNPLSLSSGNPNLKQQYNHRLMFRFNTTNAKKASNFFLYLAGEYYQNYITNSTFVATSDTIINESIVLARGSQYRQPVNLNGAWNTNAFITYGVPINFIKSNLNFNIGTGYRINPGLINDIVNNSATMNVKGGLTIASNISEKIDFTISYSASYNDVKNSTQNNSNNMYIIQNANARLNWMPWERFVVNTNFSANSYEGLGSSFNQTILLWNAGLGYKLLKQKQLELRVSVFDILNENNSITRNVTDAYIEDVQSTVLQRYFMFTATWTLKNFKGTKENKEDSE